MREVREGEKEYTLHLTSAVSHVARISAGRSTAETQGETQGVWRNPGGVRKPSRKRPKSEMDSLGKKTKIEICL